MSRKIAAFLAQGFEEAEAVVPIDMARRAGIEVDTVSIDGGYEVTGSHGITVKADKLMKDIDSASYDMLMLPGGMPGTVNLENCTELAEMLKEAHKAGKYLAAICAAPRILGDLGLLEGERATVYPGNEEHLKGAEYDAEAAAVTSGRVITARGMGCAVEFGGEIVSALTDSDTAEGILKSIQHIY